MINSSVPQSCKNIWVLLSGTSLLKSKEFIGLLLEQNAPQIFNGILYHKKFDVTVDIKEIWKKYEIDNVPIDFIEKLSKLINLDPLHCYDLFLAFLLYEFKGTPKSVQNLFKNEKNLQNLFYQLHEFYLSERLFSIFCIKQILANYHKSSSHPYQSIFFGFYEAINKKDRIINKLLEQLNECITAKLPNRNDNGPYLNDCLINNWIKNNIMETLKIVECILIYIKHADSDGELTKKIIITFQENTFFTRYPYLKQISQFSDSLKYENLIKLITFTQVLIIIESLKLKKFKEAIDQNNTNHYLLKDNKLVSEINNLIQSKCNSLEIYSPILMSWMIIKSLKNNSENQQQIEYLGTISFNLNVLEYISTSLQSTEFQNLTNSPFSTIVKNVIGSLLSNFFLQFDVDILKQKTIILFKICSLLFDDNDLNNSILKKQDDCGLYLIYLKAFSNFSINLIPLLELTYSISKTIHCSKFINILSNMSLYSEYFNYNTPLLSLTDEKGVYQLNADRKLFNDDDFIITKGSLGILTEESEEKGYLIEWQNLQLNGLKMFFLIYKDRIDKVSCSGLHIYNSYMIEISLLNNIFAKMLKYYKSNNLIQTIAQSFYVFKLFKKYSNVPRLFISSSLNLFSALIELDSKYESIIWDHIAESSFFPYMIGSLKDQQVLYSEQDVNASRIGELIVSEECMKGEYDLCRAYLNLLSISFPKDNSLSCTLLIHVVTEIFPCFQQWHYKKISEYKNIAFKCLSIFQSMLLLQNNEELVNICKFNLLSGPAGETLLKIIVKGENLVREIIEQTGNSNVLLKDELIIMVRNSLTVLNRLLLLQEKDKNKALKTSAVEQALFSTQCSKPNMILVLTHYVFQRYDTRLATLAITLLKRLSKHFPMSLLACLGFEAESVRDHFLYRLEEVTEDIRLKKALLDFLSCCIKHQPGLIEMFLNSDNQNKTTATHHNCLNTVLEILEEKLNQKYFCSSELHSAAIKFIYTFWLQPHLLAIDSLKKNKNLWTLICFPIYQEINNLDEKLFGNIFKIIAREIFYIKTLEKKFDILLVDIFKKFSEGDYLITLSEHINKSCAQKIDNKNMPIFYLLKGWRDFLVSVSKFNPFEIDEAKKKIIVNNLIKNILDQLNIEGEINHDLLQTLCEICVTLLSKWKSKQIMNTIEEWKIITTSILYIANEKKEILTLGFIVNLETMLSLSLQAFENETLNIRDNLKDWYSPWCGLFKFIYQILEKNIAFISDIELKLTCATLGLFHNLFNATKEINATWLFVIRNNLILESMVSLLCYLIENNCNLQLIDTIQNTFILLSTVPSAAHLLQITHIVDKISHSLLSAKKDEEFIQIFELTLQLATSLLMTIKHHYVESAINLISVHLDKIVSCLHLVRECPFHERIQEATKIMGLLTSLTPYKNIWITLNKNSFDTLLSEIQKTTHSLIAFLIRPNLLQYLIKNRNSPINANILKSSEKNKNDQNVNRVISFDLDLSNQLDTQIHQIMFNLLLQHLTFLNHVNPNLLQIQFNNCDNKLIKIIDISFSAPNIDSDKKIGFGTLLYCLSLVVRLLNKFEKSSDNNKEECKTMQKFTNKNQLIFILEASLSLLISQAILAQSNKDLSERDKLTIRRDLKTELASMFLPKNRHSKRAPNISFNSSLIYKNQENFLTSHPYIKFLIDSVEEFLKN